MWMIPGSVKIYLARKPADMRRSFNGLCGYVRDELQQAPESGHLFVFRNKRSDRIKILYFDRNGLAIWYKRLEEGRFHWPEIDQDAIELSATEMSCLIDGIEIQDAKRYKRFRLPA
jgi:transposase